MSHILALDEGTTSTRAVIFSEDGRTVASSAQEFRQHFPSTGLVEHDAAEIWRTSREVIGRALGTAALTAADISAVGITNQRETTVLWDRATGEPIHRAIVWQDTRGAEFVGRLTDAGLADEILGITGLPVNTYFSAIKLMWLLESDPRIRERAEAGELLFGTIDSWLIWNLTGGPRGGIHVTDVTNASRTLLMDLASLQWSPRMLEITGIPEAVLPAIRPSISEFGRVDDSQLLGGVPITGVLGDQQAAAFGQCAFSPGDTKNTYGTGCFLLTNTGGEIRRSSHGLVSTVGYAIEGQPPSYALEGSIAVAGSVVQWLRDELGLISSAAEIEELAGSVPDCGDVYFVPAFSGLFAPRWRPDARGTIVGLTRFTTKAHIARAALESTAFQTAEVLASMRSDSGFEIERISADGGMSVNDTLMQFQADVLGCEVVRPRIVEATALGAAFAAGIGVGTYADTEEVAQFRSVDRSWTPQIDAAERDRIRRRWDEAVQRSLGWV
jgi:glycerol kinase